MDQHQFDLVVRALTSAKSRRGASRLLAGPCLGALLSPMVLETDAKKKKKKKKKKKQSDVVPPPPPPPPPPSSAPPPPPPPTGPGFCAHDGISNGLQASKRWAQTFLPPRGGPLTSATFSLRASEAGFDATVQIRTVDSLGVPANSILATEQLDNISQTTFPAINPVSVTFDPPPILQIGQIYALVITGSTAFFAIHANTSGNTCADGRLFQDALGDGAFDPVDDKSDLVYDLTIAG